jgi:hypothetical protein
MVLVNTKTDVVHENVNYLQVGMLIGVSQQQITSWAKKDNKKKYDYWILYFNVIRFRKGMRWE